MSKELYFEAESVEEALTEAAAQLDLAVEDIRYEVVEKGAKKLFGLGSSKLSKIQVFVDADEDDDEVDANDTINAASEVSDASNETVNASSPDLSERDFESLEDSDIDAIADEAIAVISKIASLSGAKDFSIEEFEGEEGEIILDIVGDDLSFLIGRHGRTLEAVQTLASAIVTKRVGMRYPIAVDVEGYRHRRKQKVIEIAQRAAARSKTQGRPVSLKPMTAQERRLCHIAIRDISGVESSSEGSGNYRHVVVFVTKD